MDEFELIHRYFEFSSDALTLPDVSVGDDCSLLSLPEGEQLAVSTDALVEGVHFPVNADSSLIARRALRVNLSDLAAMSARPLGFHLALTLPEVRPEWLQAFSMGLAEDARHFGCPLIGGDTTRGPLSIAITVMGAVPRGQALLRSGASAGDDIYVTGTLGDAAIALKQLALLQDKEYLWQRYWLPEPRLDIARHLRGLATAALDISDGLLQDVGHIVRASSVRLGKSLRASIEWEDLPLSADGIAICNVKEARQAALAGGDDYELCFTLPREKRADIERVSTNSGLSVTRIGTLMWADQAGVDVIDTDGNPLLVTTGGYNHFRN